MSNLGKAHLPLFNFQSPSNDRRPKSFPATEPHIPITEAKVFSRHISHSDSPINVSKNTESLQRNIRIRFDISRNSLRNIEDNRKVVLTSTDFQTTSFLKTKHPSFEPISSSEVKDTVPRNDNQNENALETQNFTSTRPNLNTANEINCERSSKTKSDVRIVREHHYEEIDEDDDNLTANILDDFLTKTANKDRRKKFNEIRAIFNKDERSINSGAQRWLSSQDRFNSTENEDSKVETEECNTELDEDEIWKYYTERPLLPLKPLQKQRSLSCINLVQTIKEFSKKKINASNRLTSPINNMKTLLFPEHALIQEKEISTSQANISETRNNITTPGLTAQRVNDGDFGAKNIRQSLLPNYTWFHLVDAKEASKRLLEMQLNGAFLIRPASKPTNDVLHTLCVVFSRRVYNFHVKSLKDGRISIGRRGEETFSSLLDMIKYHQNVPISINTTESDQVSYVYLLITPPK